MEVDEFIEHFGTRGMKWGVRNDKSSLSVKTSADYRKVAELKKKPKPSLTNKQLKTANERMQLERSFSQMNPSTVKKGHDFLKGALASAALGISVYSMVNSPAGKAFMGVGKKAVRKTIKK